MLIEPIFLWQARTAKKYPTMAMNYNRILFPKQVSYFWATTDGAAMIFPTTLGRGVFSIHISRVAPDRDLGRKLY